MAKLEIKSWTEADRAMVQLAELDAKQRALDAERDKALVAVCARFESPLAEVILMSEQMTAALKKFAQAHKSEFKPAPNGDGRSYEHAGVIVGFRQSPGRVEIRKEEEAIEWLRDFREGVFVRVIHEADREKLLEILRPPRRPQDDRVAETLAAHGIKFEQKDKFFLEIVNSK